MAGPVLRTLVTIVISLVGCIGGLSVLFFKQHGLFAAWSQYWLPLSIYLFVGATLLGVTLPMRRAWWVVLAALTPVAVGVVGALAAALALFVYMLSHWTFR